MAIKKVAIISLFFFLILAVLHAQQGLVSEFKIEPNDMALERLAHPGTPFNKAGRKFAILADECGSFEAWAYPLKLLRSFEFSFLTSGSTRLIHGRDIVRYISVSPEATTLTYTYQSFSVKAIFITPVEEAGAVLPFVRGLLGLEGNVLDKSVSFAPHFPANWDHVSIDNFKIGKTVFSFDYRRDKNKIIVFVKARDAGEYRFWFAPALGAGTHIQSLVVDGHPFDFKYSEDAQVVQPFLNIPVNKDSVQIEISFLPAFEIFPLLQDSKVGNRNKSLKIISFHREGSKFELIVEGLAGNTYQLGTMNPETVESLEGAEISKGSLRFVIPQGKNSEFVSHKVIIQVAHRNNEYLIRRQEEEEQMNLRACLRSTKIFNAISSPIFSALMELRVFILSNATMSPSHH